MTISVRVMKSDELDWVNQQYQSINFMPTDLADRQFIAEIESQRESQRVGLGRLTYISDEIWELGGIYVLPDWRGKSVAREIVKYLLGQANDIHLYCLAFPHLVEFYQKMGFVRCSDWSKIPQKLTQKRQWCQQTYPEGAILLEMDRSS